ADLLLSDYSGALFDGLFAEVPLLLLHDPEPAFGAKLDANSLEYEARDRLGPVLLSAGELAPAVARHFAEPGAYVEANETLRAQLFDRRPGAAVRAAEAIEGFAARWRREGLGALPSSLPAKPKKKKKKKQKKQRGLRGLKQRLRAFASKRRSAVDSALRAQLSELRLPKAWRATLLRALGPHATASNSVTLVKRLSHLFGSPWPLL